MSNLQSVERSSWRRVALANLRYPETPEESVELAEGAVFYAGSQSAEVICFPECYIPGYRGAGKTVPAPDSAFLERAWSAIAKSARIAGVTVILGTERIVDGALRASAIVIDKDGEILGFQDKVQLAPEEDGLYSPGTERRLFESRGLKFGIAICHEGWRYPETVRWAARRGAKIVFHPHYHEGEAGTAAPASFPANPGTVFEYAMLCRAAENTCFFTSVNCAGTGACTTSTIVRPDGTPLAFQPYGREGVLIADVDLAASTGLFAARCKYP